MQSSIIKPPHDAALSGTDHLTDEADDLTQQLFL